MKDNAGEFGNLVFDEILSIVMAVVIRQYVNALFQVRATVGAAKMRDEAVHGVTAYLSWSVQRIVQKLVGLRRSRPMAASVCLSLRTF